MWPCTQSSTSKDFSLVMYLKKVKSDFFRIVIEYSKSNGNLVTFYIEPITPRLLDLIEDDEFNVDNFTSYHLSMPIDPRTIISLVKSY